MKTLMCDKCKTEKDDATNFHTYKNKELCEFCLRDQLYREFVEVN